MKKISWKMIYFIAAVLGAISFLVLYGVNVLNPFYTDWLISGGDLTQHYLGWEYFRKSNWFFPIGLADQLAYPVKTSIIYTDSIPLFAIVFKVLTAGIEGRFQYFGLWGIMCFTLQGFFAARILQHWLKDKWQVLLSSLFFIWSPIMIFRMYYHTSLAAHWLILLSIYLWTVHKENYRKIGKTSLQWGVVGALIASIHLYFVPMCGALLCGYILFSFVEERKIKIKYIAPGIAFVIGLFGNVTLLGGFSSNVRSASSDSLGYYSFNLNGFLNPIGYSKIMKWLDVYKEGQYEGFAYLGFGILIFLTIAMISFALIWKKGLLFLKENWMKSVIVSGVVLGLTLLAASHKITFNSHLLLELPDIDMIMKYWSIFGSSGRLIWPVYYLLMLIAVIKVVKLILRLNWQRVAAYIVLLIGFAVQIYDMSDKLVYIHKDYFSIKGKANTLESDLWDTIETAKYEHVVWVSHNVDARKLMYFADWALEHDLTMNRFYFARSVNVQEQVKKEMHQLNEKTIYIFVPTDTDELEDYQNYKDKLYFYEADGYIIGSVLPIAARELTE